MLLGEFEEFEQYYPELVAIDSEGNSTGEVMDFCESSALSTFVTDV